MLLSNSVFHSANIILQYLTFITAKLARYWFTALVIAQRESSKAERRNCEFSTALR